MYLTNFLSTHEKYLELEVTYNILLNNQMEKVCRSNNIDDVIAMKRFMNVGEAMKSLRDIQYFVSCVAFVEDAYYREAIVFTFGEDAAMGGIAQYRDDLDLAWEAKVLEHENDVKETFASIVNRICSVIDDGSDYYDDDMNRYCEQCKEYLYKLL